MKRMMMILAVMLIAMVPAVAQGWEYMTIPADDFYNTKEDDVTTFYGENFVAVLSFTNNDFKMKLTDGDRFDVIDVGEMAFLIIGLYDDNGNLVKRGEAWAKLNRTHTAFTLVTPTKSGWVKWPEEMMLHLQGGKGAIRIASPTIQRDYFDVTMPCVRKE